MQTRSSGKIASTDVPPEPAPKWKQARRKCGSRADIQPRPYPRIPDWLERGVKIRSRASGARNPELRVGVCAEPNRTVSSAVERNPPAAHLQLKSMRGDSTIVPSGEKGVSLS